MAVSLRSLLITLAASASLGWADQLIVSGMQPQPVTFTGFADNKLTYQTRAGETNEREIERVSHIAVDGENAFNEAETAFAKDEKDKAIDGYTKAIRGTNKPWLRNFAARRLLIALGTTDRFDARVVAYMAILMTNPDEATQHRPELPPKGNRQLDTAIQDAEAALKQPGLGGPQQVGLYTFLIDLHRRKGDEAAATATLERLAKLAETLGDMPEIKEQLAGAKVAQARLALDQKKYAEAIKLIEDNRGSITDPRLQSDALFTLAQAKLATANKNDKAAMQDIALTFMRVVAHFGDAEGKPNVLASLQATAGILQQIQDKDGAIAVLEQIVREFPNDPAAQKAKQELQTLQPAS